MSSGTGPFGDASQQQLNYTKTDGDISLAFAFHAPANVANHPLGTAPATPVTAPQNGSSQQQCRNFPISMMHGFHLRGPNVVLPTTNGGKVGGTGVPFPQMTTAPPNASSINRSQRCGVCRGCQCKPCGACTYCQDSPQFGGPGVKKQSCIERRCLRVLENRLQRDSPTFKARVGCGKCDDCRMPDCQVCLVCLDKRFFANRYMTGALCHKKRCNNSCSLELTSHHHQSANASPTIKFPKRSLDSSGGGGEVEIAFKRREPPLQSHGRPDYRRDSSSTGEMMATAKVEQHADEEVTGVGHVNGAQQTIIANGAVLCDTNGVMPSQQAMTYLQQECTLSAENMAHLVSRAENSIGTSVQSGAPIAVEPSLAGMMSNCVNQQLLQMNGITYAPGANSYLLTPACTGIAPNGVSALPYPATTNPIQQAYYNQYQYQQQQMRMLVLDNHNHNYPKYEYCDEQAYRYMHGGLIPPPDPFIPPSYSTDTTNAVVLQPL